MGGTLTPAYGRDYKSKKAALEDWNNEKDFVLNTVQGGGLINREQANESGATSFQVRWKNMTMVGVIKKSSTGIWK